MVGISLSSCMGLGEGPCLRNPSTQIRQPSEHFFIPNEHVLVKNDMITSAKAMSEHCSMFNCRLSIPLHGLIRLEAADADALFSIGPTPTNAAGNYCLTLPQHPSSSNPHNCQLPHQQSSSNPHSCQLPHQSCQLHRALSFMCSSHQASVVHALFSSLSYASPDRPGSAHCQRCRLDLLSKSVS